MAFDFPNNPTVNQIVTGPAGQSFQWDGTKWIALLSGGSGAQNPPPSYYQNSQGPVVTPPAAPTIAVDSTGQYIFARLDVPHSGDRQITISTHYCTSVQNATGATIDVYAEIGVSNPSEFDFPMRPYVGVLHSVSRAQILPGAMAVLHAMRMDVIDPTLLATPIPWTMVVGGNGTSFPQMAAQVFAPTGTLICNDAFMAIVNG